MAYHKDLSLSATAILWAAVGVGVPVALGQTQPGWTLFAPNSATTTYLIDLAGTVQHSWPSAYTPGFTAYLLDGGGLLRAGVDSTVTTFGGPGSGGRVQKIAWDGTVEWSYVLADVNHCPHHDVMPMPNGNVLAILWERKTLAEALAAGRNPATIPDGEVWSEALYEIQPIGATGGQVVWEWHAWDHLVQHFDATKPNYDLASNRPERINLNYTATPGAGADWLHANGVDYNAELDQIVLSVHNFSELWVISHAPGASGDLLYRWGNAAAYGLGTAANRKLYLQHNPQWIKPGLPGAGHLLVFNNGTGRTGGNFSSVDEITTPVTAEGTYARTAGAAFGPTTAAWTCTAASGVRFYSANIGGMQRTSNGNTLVCVGMSGKLIELSSTCENVWSYTNVLGVPVSTAATFRASRIEERDPRLAGLMWCPADLGSQGGTVGGDDLLDNNDFVVFIDLFFGFDTRADLGKQGGSFGADGFFDNNDFVVFIDRFFNGC